MRAPSSLTDEATPAIHPVGMDEALRSHTIVLFDGVCNFCDQTVHWLIARDPKAQLRFAPLQSEVTATLREHFAIPEDLRSLIVLADGQLYLQSDAALRIARSLEGWPRMFLLFRIVPRPLRDAAYCLFARHRYAFFGRRDACMLPTPQLEARFLTSPSGDNH